MKVLRGCITAFLALVLFYALQYVFAYTAILIGMKEFGYDVFVDPDFLAALLSRISMPATLFSDLAIAAVIGLSAVLLDKEPLRYLALNKMSLYTVPTMLIFGVTASTLVGVMWALIPFPQSMWDYYNSLMESIAVDTPVAVIAVVIAAPIAEELLCRSLLIREFRRFMHPILAVFVSAALFGLIHGNVIQGTYAFVCGVLMGFIYLRYRSVVASILFHVGFNASSYLLGGLETLHPLIQSVVALGLIGIAVIAGFCAFFFNGKHAKENLI